MNSQSTLSSKRLSTRSGGFLRPWRIAVHGCKARQSAAGFTLTELMIAMALGSFVLALALKALANGRAAWQTAEHLAELEERAAFALTALEEDVQIAGYWGAHADGAPVTAAAHVRIHCRGADVTVSTLATEPVAATDGTYALPCPAATTPVGGTDTLTVRHAEAMEAQPEAGRVQVCTTPSGGTIFQDGTRPISCAADTPVHNVQINSWYVGSISSERNLPALYRYTLVSDGLLQNQEIMPGVEDLQITLGVDRDANGMIDGFVDPGSEPGARVLAVRFWLLVREGEPEPGHVDNGPWYSIDTDRTTPLLPGDHYRRTSGERIVWLRNRQGR